MRGANNLFLRNAFVERTGAPLLSSLLFVKFRLWIEIHYSVLAVLHAIRNHLLAWEYRNILHGESKQRTSSWLVRNVLYNYMSDSL